MGFFAEVYDLFIIGVAATLITAEWHIASYEKSLLTPLALLTRPQMGTGQCPVKRYNERLRDLIIAGRATPVPSGLARTQ